MVLAAVQITERKIAYGLKVKAEGAGRVGGYLVCFGFPRDTHGEFFTGNTDFGLDYFDGPKRPVYYHHRQDGADQVVREEIGYIYKLLQDDNGLYAEAQLDMNNPYARRAYDEVLRGEIGWSSGSAPHLVDGTEDGEITKWMLVEGSLTPDPAAGPRTTVYTVKFADVAPTEVQPEGRKAKADARVRGACRTVRHTKNGAKKMDQELLIGALESNGVAADVILSILKDVSSASAPAQEAPEEPTMAEGDPQPEDEMYRSEAGAPVAPAPAAPVAPGGDNGQVTPAQIKAWISEAVKAAAPGVSQTTPYSGGAAKPNPRITDMRTPYHDLSAREMDYMANLRRAFAKANGAPPLITREFQREMVAKAQKDYTKGALKLDQSAARQLMSIKSNELQNTGVAGDGADWVPTLWSSDLWELSRVDNQVASSLRMIEMPSDSYELPVESTDPTVYAVAEAANESDLVLTAAGGAGIFTSSKMTVDKVTLNAAKMGLQVKFSAEVNEDSIIQFIPQLRNQAMRSMQDSIDYVILNADATTGTANINYKGANTSAAPKSKFLYGGGDGIRHLPLVEATTLLKDGGGSAPDLSLIRSTIAKLRNAYSIKPADLAFFCDVRTWHKLKSIDELLVYMNNGRGSTVNDGMVPTIDGSTVYPSAELALTDSTGFALNDGTGTLGQLLVVHLPSWIVGYRRQIASAVDYLAYYDSYVLTMTVRMALQKRDAQCAALLYNLNVN
jgi:hypothetical protein